MRIKNKKGIELTFQTIIVLIILIIVLIVIVMFFANHYGTNQEGLMNISQTAIDGVR